jgi:hypothetical protein
MTRSIADAIQKYLGSLSSQPHQHRCKACGTIWEHIDAEVGFLPDELMTESHKCPKCGRVNLEKYTGRVESQFMQRIGIQNTPIPRKGNSKRKTRGRSPHEAGSTRRNQ